MSVRSETRQEININFGSNVTPSKFVDPKRNEGYKAYIGDYSDKNEQRKLPKFTRSSAIARLQDVRLMNAA